MALEYFNDRSKGGVYCGSGIFYDRSKAGVLLWLWNTLMSILIPFCFYHLAEW